MKFKLNTSPFAKALLIGFLALSVSACHEDHEDALIVPDEPVIIPPANTAPIIDSTSVDSVEEGSVYSYTVTASDAEGDALTLTASTLPAWLTFDAASGLLTGTPAATDVGDHPVTIEVSDGSLSASQSFTIAVTAIVVANSPPSITSTAIVSGTVGVEYTYTLTATDADGDSLDLSSVILPTWGAFDSSTGILSGTPDLADSYDVELMVSDGTDAVSQTFTIVVTEAGTSNVELLVFENAALAEWALWDCCAGSTPSVETDDVDHDQVAEFDVLAAPETVQGFTARDADGAVGGMPFDASALSSTGTLSFEMKVVTAPAAGTPWFLKLESDNGASNTGDVALNTSNEGLDPVTGEWQTYTFNLADLAAAGLDLSAIDVIMVFPAWGQGAGAVYRVDNVMIVSTAGTPDPDPAPEPAEVVLSVFEDAALAEWALWDCCAGSIPSVETDDVDHDQVAEFDVLAAPETVQGFTARDADGAVGGMPFDASAYASTGTLSFEMKVVTAPAAGTPWFLKLESDNGASNTGDVALNTSNEGLDPVTGEWQTYTFNLADLAAAGLDLSAIDVIMVFPAWGQGAGAVYRVDNVMIVNTAGTPDPDPAPEPAEVVLSVFEDAALAEWALWDCCAGSIPSVETDDVDHDQVAEFDVLAAPETVQGFTARDADGAVGGMPFDASAYASTGKLSLEMKVVTAPAAGTPWFLKLESDNGASNTGDVALNTSNEGLDPVTGEWQTYTFNLADLAAAGLDLSAIDVIMVFPAWGQGAGAVYRVDNVIIYADGTMAE